MSKHTDPPQNLKIDLRRHPELRSAYRTILYPPIFRSALVVIITPLMISNQESVLHEGNAINFIILALTIGFLYFPYIGLKKYAHHFAKRANLSLAPHFQVNSDIRSIGQAFSTIEEVEINLTNQETNGITKPKKPLVWPLFIEFLILSASVVGVFFPGAVILLIILPPISAILFDSGNQTRLLRLIRNEWPSNQDITNYPRESTVKTDNYTIPPSLDKTKNKFSK